MENNFLTLHTGLNPDDYHCIFKSDHLHLGFWPEDAVELSAEEALHNLFELLASFLPEPPAKILDVGCGLGLSSHLLASRGYAVTAIDASNAHVEYATSQYGASGAHFKTLAFLDSDESVFAEGTYDALFFQECFQYLSPLDENMKKARYLLKDKGVIVLADEVCYDRKRTSDAGVHLSFDIYVSLSENGFRIIQNRKIGTNVMPTYGLIINRLAEQVKSPEAVSAHPDSKRNFSNSIEYLKEKKALHERGQVGYEIFVAKKDPFRIRSYETGDEHHIVPMFNEIFGENRNLDHWYWKFRDNPFGSHQVCMAFSPDGKMVSHYAGFPVPICAEMSHGRTLNFTVPQIGDTMTHPSVRRIGLGKTGILARTAHYYYARFCEGLVPFGYGPNTANMRKLGERYLGYTYLDPIPYWVLNLSFTRVRRPGLLSRMVKGYTVQEVYTVDEEWNTLFDRLCPLYKFLIKRDATYIKWRYLDCPDHIHRVFALRKRGELVGWSVFSVKDNRLLWGDALLDKKHLKGLSHLLYHVVKEGYPGVETIEAWFSRHPDWWSNHLKTLGFEIVEEPDKLAFCYHTFWNDILETETLHEKLNHYFYYTWGDSDLF
ncbi:MAG: GNAT family N-acetyltransferase [Deltaproteobacteria bacterium]|nr:GNAT family N-acetyltransferase [Deltaproteobacteria bacterium]